MRDIEGNTERAVELGTMQEMHETSAEIIQGIYHFERKIESAEDWKNGVFANLIAYKKEHEIDIYNMCIVRLWERHEKLWIEVGTQAYENRRKLRDTNK